MRSSREFSRALTHEQEVKAIVITGADGNFCSGGDVHEIIGPLTRMQQRELLKFTRMTGELVLKMRTCPQPIIAAVDGVCAGAGACIAMASDMRLATRSARTAFLFTRVGLAGCDMGACAILPRIIGQGRASELLYTGRSMTAQTRARRGDSSIASSRRRCCNSRRVELASEIARGPTLAHAMTKKMLHEEWSLSVDAAIEAEAQAQANCMQSEDFQRAYRAFAAKERPNSKAIERDAKPCASGYALLRCRSPGACRVARRHLPKRTLRRTSGGEDRDATDPPAAARWQSLAARASFSTAFARRMAGASWILMSEALRCCAKPLPGTMPWLISHSPCRASGARRFRLRARPNRKPAICRRWRRGQDCRVRAFRARSRLGCRRDAMLRARGSATDYILDGAKSWISNGGIADFYCVFARTAPADSRATAQRTPAASALLSSMPAPPALRSRSASTASPRIRLQPCASAVAAFPQASAWAPRAKASSLRCARWIFSAPRSPRPRWALRVAPWMRRSRTPVRGACLAIRLRIFN